MSVILSAASCLTWIAKITGYDDIGTMITESVAQYDTDSTLIFLPYLSGERTPHNDPNAMGVFYGMTHKTSKYDLIVAVLEGVGFAFSDGIDALNVTKCVTEEISLIGGGAKSEIWRQMLSDILGKKLIYRSGGDIGPALGAARLAMLGANPNLTVDEVCPRPSLVQRHKPDPAKHIFYQERRKIYQDLYKNLKEIFHRNH
jgi:xylulokinase